MRSLNAILMLLVALSVLSLGALPVSAMTAESPPPCHAASAPAQTQHQSPAPSSEIMTAMTCCIAWVVAPAPRPPSPALVATPAQPSRPVLARLPAGLAPAPEHGPPKT